VNEGIRALDRKSAFAVSQRDARFDLNVSGSVMVWVVVVVNGCMVAGWCVVYAGVAEVEVGEGPGALDRKSALYVTVYVVDRRNSCVNGLRKCDIKMSVDCISRNLSVELHLVQRQVYDCYTAMIRQRKCAWPVQRETGIPHWQSFEMTRKLSLM